MPTVLLNMSMSLDGFVAGPQVSAQAPMGVGGERLHTWLSSGSQADTAAAHESTTGAGAAVIGRRMFDVGLQFWRDTPYPCPTFVLTHEVREPLPQTSAVFTFVNEGIVAAVQAAVAAAGDKPVLVMGGPDIAAQALRAGLIDEIKLQLVPVLLGHGTRVFDAIDLQLEQLAVVASPHVTHLHYRVTGR